MFTLDQLKEANLKVQSGEDFPAYIQELIKLGVTGYDTHVADGHTIYSGKNNQELKSEVKYPTLEIAEKADAGKFRNHLKAHQMGQTHYLSFCKHAAESGIEKWKVNTTDLTCTYLDRKGNAVLTEPIPVPSKTR